MGTECVATMINNDTDPAIPPGFGPFVSNSNSACNDSVSSSGNEITRKSRRNRRTVGYNELDTCSDEDYTHKNILPSARKLPKGVIRGCAQCLNCQKVVARWKPENACRPVLDEAPVFYPTEEEFKDTLKYIETIRPHAEPYGIGRIVPPWTWRPPCVLKDKCIWGTSQFATRVQRLDKLQNRESSKNICEDQTSTATTSSKRRKVMGNETGQNGSNSNVVERFGFEPGPDFTLETFSKFADDFKTQYFGLDTNEGFEPSVENIEGEYWRIVENPSSEIEVLYGADLETKSFGSGFPKQKDSIANSSEMEDEYVKSGWNLNNFARLPGSVLSFESGEISGVLIPWLYVGMCFSSFCWHVEDHHLYSLNYNHWGAPKIWYGVPGNDASKLETAMRKHLPDLFEEQPDLLHNLVTQFSPALLKQEGIPVYRCVQREGEFVITFPRAYHAGFNCGFNCAEAVNVAPVDWLPHGQYAVELYREQGRKISVSHDKMLLGAAREAVRAQWEIAFLKNNSDVNLRWKNSCGPTTVLSRTLKARIGVERERRGNLCNISQPKKMDSNFDSTDRECAICHYDLHLSAACCPCDVDRYGCLLHAKELCKCDWSTRVFLYRYDITELDVLCDAVSGKLSAVHRWALSDLRLSLRSCLAKKEEVKKESGKDESKNIKIVVSSKEETKEVLLEPCSKKDEIENVILPQNQCSNLEDNNKKDNNEIVNLPSLEREISVVVALSCTHDVKPRQNKNKGGPRVANVVRKFSCSVEVLEYGTVVSRKNWCTSQTIFPKGYRSRVKYRSVIDPTQMCFYISEIIDGGDSGPLFMVRVEESRDEVFIHVSAIKCWEMVREKLILEMRRQNIKGKNELPPLPPPGSIDGLEMFGLTSPHILKEIEALDQDRDCNEYWNSRPNNNIHRTRTERNPNLVAFKGLLQKAGPEEIEALREILSGDVANVTRQEAILLVNKESERFHLK